MNQKYFLSLTPSASTGGSIAFFSWHTYRARRPPGPTGPPAASCAKRHRQSASSTASADDKFALVQEFDYGSGQTTNYIVNVTKNKRIDAKKTNLLPAVADEERVQASSLVMQNDDVRRKLGADVNNVELFVTPVDPASFNTVRVARVAFSVKGRALPFVKYVDLKNGKLIKTR